jgi:hypothetical protein
MTECINGGAVWQSGVWDYGHDAVVIQSKWKTHFNVMRVESVEQPGCTGRYVVGLFPHVTVHMPLRLLHALGWIFNINIKQQYPELTPLRTVKKHGRFYVGRFNRGGGDWTDIRPDVEDGTMSTMPTADYQALLQLANDDPKLNYGTVEHHIVNTIKPGVGKLGRETSACYAGNKMMWAQYFLARPNGLFDICYTFIKDNTPMSVESLMPNAANMAPNDTLRRTGRVPVPTEGNDEESVLKRIKEVVNDVEPPRTYADLADEFVQGIVGQICAEGHLQPAALQDIIDAQSRPTQKARNANWGREGGGRQAKVKSFLKLEMYEGIKPPRTISTVQTEDTLQLGRYMATLKKKLREHFEWFMPCRTPTDTTSRIHEFCKHHKSVIETDYSKFDGSLSRFLRMEVEQEIMKAAFNNDKALLALLKRDIQLPASTTNRVRYNTGYARNSGSQTTTVGNTLINAFVAYCALRTTIRQPSAALKKIGPKFGDDGIDAIIPAHMLKVAKDLGLSVKLEDRSTDEFVTFCGRYYIMPRTCKHSIFNVSKALASIPIAFGDNKQTRKTHMKAKIEGYLAMDPETPVLSQYARQLLKIYKLENVRADFGRDLNMKYKVQQGPWPRQDDEITKSKELVVIAKMLNLQPQDIPHMIDAIASCRHPGDIGKAVRIPPQAIVVPPSHVYAVPSGRRRSGPLKQHNE